MAQPKKQRKGRGKSAPKKRAKNLSGGPPSVTPPKGSYFAYINKQGKRVKAGNRGAKRITVRVNRTALQKAAKIAGRIGGKFAPKSKAKTHAKRSAAAKRSASKSALTRKIKREGGTLSKDFVTDELHVHYRYWDVPYDEPQNVQLYRNVIQREQVQGARTFHVLIKGRDRDGNLIDRNTPAFFAKPDNAESAAEEITDVVSKYEFSRIVGMTFRFRYARD